MSSAPLLSVGAPAVARPPPGLWHVPPVGPQPVAIPCALALPALGPEPVKLV
eukprot:CAMPEP_0176243802 /NCGR_PEP_ID=MMETSP0121_2-20121125/31109_1 /TAXON_ID=160619 /ORGANISM="Kryptoperidinium foliaceum, Strain CCMP 1326" /LENGTH=51 /DNA_ID=CAMNT_0017583401 /DNA_START=8 /DNA_END=160 /DNA_ORIENTATION=-